MTTHTESQCKSSELFWNGLRPSLASFTQHIIIYCHFRACTFVRSVKVIAKLIKYPAAIVGGSLQTQLTDRILSIVE